MDEADLLALVNDSMTSSYELADTLHQRMKAYQQMLNDSAAGGHALASSMDEQLTERASRIRFSIMVGAIAIVAGVLALWGSSTMSAGFDQALLVATGGALITFCLVELILNKIVEIPAKEARKREKEVSALKTYVEALATIDENLSNDTKGTDAELEALMRNIEGLARGGT